METILEICFALFAVLGIFSLLWMILGKLIVPDLPRAPLVSIVLGFGSGDDLEQAVNRLKWMQGMDFFNHTVVIADVTLNDSGRQIAARLAEQEHWVRLLPFTELTEWMNSSYITMK